MERFAARQAKHLKPETAMTARLLLALLFILGPLAPLPLLDGPLVGAAYADDDDDDDDDGGGSSSEVANEGNLPARRSPRRAAPPPPPPDRAPGEIVLLGLDPTGRDALTAAGFTLKRESGDLILLTVPGGADIDAALAQVALIAPGVLAAPNHYYRPQQSECEAGICADWTLAGFVPSAAPACRFAPTVGIVDTGINLDHEMLAGAAIELERFSDAAAEPSGEKHGTAIAAMFVGRPDARVPGLVPDVSLVIADPFASTGSDERADAYSLYLAIDALVDREVAVINLSLAGPDNPILARAVADASIAGIPAVAAVGNAGPQSAPLFPAGYESVVAVTAVDRNGRIYRRAVQGPHVDLAAPGVGIPTAASIRGVRPQTGTSFAAPFVTVALAVQRTKLPDATPAELLAALAVRDLGDPGRDETFGEGLVQIGSLCP
jgi:hypothetical protein